ncbi:Rad2 nuclease [Collariella sp. IMI 366227]|nr:Rad2 nuclease [Collariella sp. IMI 366227]
MGISGTFLPYPYIPLTLRLTGTPGLLPLLKSIHRPTELKKYAGETFGIDAYGWLHRGAVACAVELAQGKPTRKYVDFAMHRVRMFKYFGVTPYLVFDGDFLPSKAKTEDSRAKRRQESKRIGLELLRAGKPSQAFAELQKAIDVTPEMARHLIEELKKTDIPYVVAPYEADAQMVYLERQGVISGIVSEDSDLLVFGAKRLLTKMDQHGQCVEINRRDFCAVREVSLTGWTDNEFRHMAIFSGCDYLDSVNNIGLKTAYRLIRKHKTPERVVRMLRFNGKHQIPESYLDDFKQAELTFLHQRVFCPKKQDIVLLTEPEPSVNIDDMPFIGAPVATDLARSIAVGDVNPITKRRIVVPIALSPGKRRISQALAPATGPARSLGKPINEYFKDKSANRIPLGEMDPNCFLVEGDNAGNTAEEEAPQPVEIQLPRPYLDGVEDSASPARPYTNCGRVLRRQSEPISKLLAGMEQFESSENRRRTVGPAIQVYQDPVASTRPPKKARLCQDAALDGVAIATPEKSRFFSAKQKKSIKKKAVDPILMSDDSIDEVFRNLPDTGLWRSEKSAKSAEDTHGDNADEVIEVPASSPIQHGPTEERSPPNPTSMTPLGDLLRSFSYDTAKPPRTRFAHGLPTPASSLQTITTPRTISPANSQASMPTPLQRIGARAMHRGKPQTMLSTPRTPSSSTGSTISKHFGSLPVNPAFVPLPKVDVDEVEALNRPLGGSEDQIIPESDGENDSEEERMRPMAAARRLNLSKFLYS